MDTLFNLFMGCIAYYDPYNFNDEDEYQDNKTDVEKPDPDITEGDSHIITILEVSKNPEVMN